MTHQHNKAIQCHSRWLLWRKYITNIIYR